MEKLIQVAIIAGGAYLAYDYLKKRKKNEATAAAVVEPTITTRPMVLVDAAAQEDGQEGVDVMETALAQTKGAFHSATGSSKRTFRTFKTGAASSFNGWDSDTITRGI